MLVPMFLVPMFLVLAAGLGAGCYGFPSGKLPTASIDTVKFIDAVKSLADPRFPNFPNAANMPTFSNAALCPSSSARRLFASWDFDDATRELAPLVHLGHTRQNMLLHLPSASISS